MYEVFKFIIKNYGPAIASCILMIYLCFFVKKSVNGNEQKLKDDIAMLLRENAELKAQLKKDKEITGKALQIANDKYEELSEQVDQLVKASEDNEPSNSNT